MIFSYEVVQQCLCHILHHDVSLSEPLPSISYSLENMFNSFQTQFLVKLTFGKSHYKSKFKLIKTYILDLFRYRLFKGINKE